jgi:hypothetical protein
MMRTKAMNRNVNDTVLIVAIAARKESVSFSVLLVLSSSVFHYARVAKETNFGLAFASKVTPFVSNLMVS